MQSGHRAAGYRITPFSGQADSLSGQPLRLPDFADGSLGV
jgi:hypothetical protein